MSLAAVVVTHGQPAEHFWNVKNFLLVPVQQGQLLLLFHALNTVHLGGTGFSSGTKLLSDKHPLIFKQFYNIMTLAKVRKCFVFQYEPQLH